jgi:hypothetical protein
MSANVIQGNYAGAAIKDAPAEIGTVCVAPTLAC